MTNGKREGINELGQSMVIVPRGNPVFENLNSYYWDLRRLLEHCQGEMGSGAIYLKSPTAEGVLFFEAHELLGGTYENRGEKLAGKAAIGRLLHSFPRRELPGQYLRSGRERELIFFPSP